MPTPLSKNPRSVIKSSNWATYRTWHVGFIQAKWPTAGGICEGLHASDVACAHLANASAIGMENQPRPACISRGVCASTGRQRPWPAHIGQRQATSAKACSHKPWCVGIWQTTSAKCMQHQPRHARISRGVCASARHHRPWTARIGQGLHALTVACAHLANDFSQQHAACLHVSAVACAHRLGDIGRDLRASSYGRRNRPTSAVVYTHRLGDIDCCHRTSARRRRPNDKHHQPRHARI